MKYGEKLLARFMSMAKQKLAKANSNILLSTEHFDKIRAILLTPVPQPTPTSQEAQQAPTQAVAGTAGGPERMPPQRDPEKPEAPGMLSKFMSMVKNAGLIMFGGAAIVGGAKDKTTGTDSIGSVSGMFESGGDFGTISTGKGDAGGKSYGKYQFASKRGTVDTFLRDTGYDKEFKGLAVGSVEFDNKWKELSKTKEFQKAQTDFIKSQYYDVQSNKLADAGIDLTKRGKAVQEMVFSTSVQYGANTNLIIKALSNYNVQKLSDVDIINIVQGYKAKTVAQRFVSSSAKVQRGVKRRIEKERDVLVNMAAVVPEPPATAVSREPMPQPQKGASINSQGDPETDSPTPQIVIVPINSAKENAGGSLPPAPSKSKPSSTVDSAGSTLLRVALNA